MRRPEIADGRHIGDSLSDIQAGQRLGMKAIFIQGEADHQKAGADTAATLADVVAGSLLQAVEMHPGAGSKASGLIIPKRPPSIAFLQPLP